MKDIPGFYYDEAKNKYFRILPSHRAPPGFKTLPPKSEGDAYKGYNDGQPTRLLRSCVSIHPLGGYYGLHREMGMQPFGALSDTRNTIWAKGLAESTRYFPPVRYFCYDSLLDAYHFVTQSDPTHSKASLRDNHSYLKAQPYRSDGEIASMELSPERDLLILTAGGEHPESRLSIPATVQIKSLHSTAEEGGDFYDDPSVTLTFRTKTLWAASANPFKDQSHFAVAHSNGLYSIIKNESGWQVEYPKYRPSSDVLAVDWLSRHIIISGCRNGEISLTDARSSRSSEASSNPISSPSCVANVRTLCQNRIVVAGLEDKMNLYDLRYCKRMRDHTTTPLVTSHAYRNKATPGYMAGFDVSPELNIIAAACDVEASHGAVSLFDAGTGKALTKGMKIPQEDHDVQLSPCVRFASRSSGNIMVVASTGRGLEEWCWNNER